MTHGDREEQRGWRQENRFSETQLTLMTHFPFLLVKTKSGRLPEHPSTVFTEFG